MCLLQFFSQSTEVNYLKDEYRSFQPALCFAFSRQSEEPKKILLAFLSTFWHPC